MSRFRRLGWSPSLLGAVCWVGVSLSALAGSAEERPVELAAEGRVLSLAELLEFAAENAPLLRVAERQRGQADAERTGAAPFFRDNPTLEAGLGPRFDAEAEVDFDFFVALQQPVGISGERGRRRQAADRLGERLDAELVLARLALRRELSLAYYGAVLAERQVELAERAVTFADEMLHIAERRLGAGDGTAIEVRVAGADAASVRQLLIMAEAERSTASIRLAELSGWPLATPPRVPSEFPEIELVPAPEAPTSAASAQHPLLVARRAKVAEAEARIEVAKRVGLPTPVLGAQVAREGSAGSPANYIVLGTLGVTLPVWQRNQGEQAARRVERDVAAAEESAAERAQTAGVARARARLIAATRRVQLFAPRAQPELEQNLALLRRGVDAGEFSLLDVAVARERFLSAERNALMARADYFTALADYELAVGAPLPGSSAARSRDSDVAQGKAP